MNPALKPTQTPTLAVEDGLACRLRSAERALNEFFAQARDRGEASQHLVAGMKTIRICQQLLDESSRNLEALVKLAQRRGQEIQEDSAAFSKLSEFAPDPPPKFKNEWIISAQPAACPLCGGTAVNPVSRADRYNMDLKTAACQECEFIHTNPRPSPDEMDRFYQGPYRDLYRHESAPTEIGARAMGLGERAWYTANFLETNELLAGGSLLDVGTSEGSLLKEIRRRFPDFRAEGIEPDPQYCQFAAAYSRCPVRESHEPNGPVFSSVSLVHVLEHVLDPLEFLKAAAARLEPKGRLYIDVPDASRYHSRQSLHIAHLNHFTLRTLLKLADKAGLTPLLIKRHDPPFNTLSIHAVFTATQPDPAIDIVARL